MATQVSRASQSNSTPPTTAPKPLDADGKGVQMRDKMEADRKREISQDTGVAKASISAGTSIGACFAGPYAGAVVAGGQIANGCIDVGAGSATGEATTIAGGVAQGAGGAYGLGGEGQGLDKIADANKAKEAADAAKTAKEAAEAAKKAEEAAKAAKAAEEAAKGAKPDAATGAPKADAQTDVTEAPKDPKAPGDDVAGEKDKPRHDEPAPRTIEAHGATQPRNGGGPQSRRAIDASGAHDGRTAASSPPPAPVAAPAASRDTASRAPSSVSPSSPVAKPKVAGASDAARL